MELDLFVQFFAHNMGLSLHAFSDIPVQQWMTLLKHPDVIRHMPLADTNWDEAAIAAWAQGKDTQWKENGYGPLAIRMDGQFAGWGGFQQEDGEADFALVLFPEYWGQGSQIFHHFMRCRTALGIETVSVLLPPSRLRTRGLKRLGFEHVADVLHAGQRFHKFRVAG
ncbi:GNAT family N-acetyltransferase [Lampropedia aestuarii]|nr:GNAT family N-acetyltransferase [Lampropedia aestuarii]